jgi:hypothetical protein
VKWFCAFSAASKPPSGEKTPTSTTMFEVIHRFFSTWSGECGVLKDDLAPIVFFFFPLSSHPNIEFYASN